MKSTDPLPITEVAMGLICTLYHIAFEHLNTHTQRIESHEFTRELFIQPF
jgi:hypothetical protein